MASLNKVMLLGNLVRDPEMRYTTGGTAVCNMRLAINRSYQTRQGEDREETCFVDIEVFGRQAELCENYLQKGAPAFVEGRLRLDEWQDRNSGQNRSRLKVTAQRVQFMGAPGSRGSFDEEPDQQQPQNRENPPAQPQQQQPPSQASQQPQAQEPPQPQQNQPAQQQPPAQKQQSDDVDSQLPF